MDPFIGQIILFAGNYAPQGWAFCNGQLLPIASYTALFSILGTTYGGNGVNNFALPDLRGRAPIHFGQGLGLSPYALGETGGVETVTLNAIQMPAHTHSVAPAASSQKGNQGNPVGNVPAVLSAQGRNEEMYANAPNGSMAPVNTSSAGNGQPHENRQPYLAMNYIIALNGVFPPHS